MRLVDKLASVFRPKSEIRVDDRFRYGLAAILLTWLLMVFLEHRGVFSRFDQADLDHYTRVAPLPDDWSNRITIVVVGEDDYRDVFRSTSPIDASKLVELLQMLQTYRPQPHVIGVDFLTADWTKPLAESALKKYPLVVWAREGADPRQEAGTSDTPYLEWFGVAGYPKAPANLLFAAPSNPPDQDGAIRRYFTKVQAREPGDPSWHPVPTMPVQIASTYPDGKIRLDVHAEPVKHLRLTGPFHRFRKIPASSVLDDSDRALGQYFAGRIVLVGGAFHAGRDRYWTPKGQTDGVEILAHAIESELSGGVRTLSPLQSAALNLIVGLAFFGFAFTLRQPFDAIASVLVPIGFTFVLGWFLYGQWALFTGLATSFLGVPIGVSVEHYVEYVRLQQWRRDH